MMCLCENCKNFYDGNVDLCMDCTSHYCSNYVSLSEVEKLVSGKDDRDKLKISLVPPQIIKDIAEVRMFGTKKYKDPNNWKNIDVERYFDAMLRHILAMMEDPLSIDEESKILHYKHAACNMAFICEKLKCK